MDPESVEFLRMILLVAIQYRGDRLRIVSADESYSLFVHVLDDTYELVPMPAEPAQDFPVVLANWEPFFMRLRHRLTCGFRRRASGTQRGRFRFPVGAGAVSVEYLLRWQARRVEDIDLTIRGADSVVVPSLVDPNRGDEDELEG
jgi:hypothetical protein